MLFREMPYITRFVGQQLKLSSVNLRSIRPSSQTTETPATKIATFAAVSIAAIGLAKLINVFYNEQYGNGLSAAHQMARKITIRSDDMGI